MTMTLAYISLREHLFHRTSRPDVAFAYRHRAESVVVTRLSTVTELHVFELLLPVPRIELRRQITYTRIGYAPLLRN